MLTIKDISGAAYKPVLRCSDGWWYVNNKLPREALLTSTAADVVRQRWYDARVWAKNQNRTETLL